MSKAGDLREKSVGELNDEMNKLYREQFNLRMQEGGGLEIKTHNYKRVRRDIARIKTVINEKNATEA
ncbi:MAG: 50S ribosomal protein L29 [Gammaproteobacteria bacterium]|nr:MAG: 50S ribosomal protein L29 [Gammaproteobacteria bacterium]PIE34958.1 MAG: 50S ribosomal protein L29 [Gammaproteobacteria bacterium]